MSRFVYRFGGGVTDGEAGNKESARRQGREPRRDGLDRPAGAARLHHRDRGLRALLRRRASGFRDALARRGRRGASPMSSGDRQELRRRRRSAAGLGPLGRARVDAGDDGHGPQSRPQRRDRARASPPTSGDARFAWDSYRRFIQMYADVVLGLDHGAFEEALEIAKEDKGVHLDTELEAADWERLTGALQGAGRGAVGQALPAGRARPALGRGRRGVRLVAVGAGADLSPPQPHSRRLGHRGQRPGDGVRQYGRDLGDRRRLHPRSLDRRARLLWRISDQRPGRGRRRRHPHPAISDPRRARAGRRQGAVDGRDDAGRVRRAGPGLRPARAPLSRHAGHRVHRRARHACGCCRPARGKRTGKAALAHRRRHGARGADRRGGGGAPDRSRRRSINCSIRRSIPRPTARSSPRACPPRPAPPAARRCSTPTPPRNGRPPARR